MNVELNSIANQLQEAFEGDAWFGRNARSLLADVNASVAVEHPQGQHSIIELVLHMINWKQFAISSLSSNGKGLHYFETRDWQQCPNATHRFWAETLADLWHTQSTLIALLKGLNDAILNEQVPERNYNFRKLLNGVLQHDIYHLGQIAYIRKIFTNSDQFN